MLDAFYRAVLPGSGHYALFIGPTKQHVWAESIEDLVEYTEAREGVRDVYFATAAFESPTTRTQDNVSALRAFRLDIDAGEEKYAKYGDKVYATQRDALVGLRDFLQRTKLTPTYVLSSGWGLHVYFCLSENAPPAKWRPVAEQLKKLAAAVGLRADEKVTCDEARVLRPPGSLHSKSGELVKILVQRAHTYAVDQFAALIGFTPPLPKYDTRVNSDVVADPEGPPRSIKKIIKQCAAIKWAGTNQKSVSEPLWRAVLGVIKHTVEGAPVAHLMSQHHPDYDYDTTQEKYDRWTSGPATCDNFAGEFPGCEDCSFRGKIKSPILLGEMKSEEIAELPQEQQPVIEVPPTRPEDPWHGFIPEPFFVGEGPSLMIRAQVPRTNDAGEDVPLLMNLQVSPTLFWFSSWSEAAHTNDTAQALMHTMVRGNLRTFELDQTKVGVNSELKKFLASKAIFHANDKKAEGFLMDYTRAALERLKNGSQRPKIADRMGLRLDGDSLTCVHGKHVIHPDGTIVEAMLSEDLREFASQFAITCLPPTTLGRWDASVWDNHVRPAAAEYVEFVRRFYGDPAWQPYQLAIMLCLASPLMAFVTGEFFGDNTSLPPNGMSVSLTSRETARGKTTAVRTAMMAFGRPRDLVKDSDKLSSTDIARVSKLAMSGTMPTSMDEMGRTEETTIAGLVSMVANSSPRARSKQYGGVAAGSRWALVNMLTANRSIRDMIATAQPESAAIQMRLMEIDTRGVPMLTPQLLTDFNTEFARVQLKSTGALGALVHYELCRMGPEKLNVLVQQAVTKAAALVGSSQESRFLWRSFGAVLVLHAILRSLNMELFSLANLVDAFKSAYNDAVAFVAAHSLPASGTDLMEKMLNELRSQIIVTQTMTHGGHERTKTDVIVSATGRTPDDPVGRFVRGEGRLYLSGRAITDWAHKNKISPNDILNDCRRRGVLMTHPGTVLDGNKPKTGDLVRRVDLFRGLGTDGVSRMYCYCIDTRKLDDFEVEPSGNVIKFPTKEIDSGPETRAENQ